MHILKLTDGIAAIQRWMDDLRLILRPFQQYFSHIGRREDDYDRLRATKPRLCLKRFLPPARIKPGTVRSTGQHLTY